MRLLAFDTETFLITDTDSAPKPVCCTWYDGKDRNITHPSEMRTAVIFADPNILYVGQNIAYDLVLLMRWHPHLIPDIIRALDEGRVFDTQMRERMMHLSTVGGKGYPMFVSLADMTLKYLKLDISADKKGDDIWRLKYGTLDGIPFNEWPSEALRYAMDDAVHTYDVFQAQGGISNIQPTEQMQVQASVVLQAIGVWGFAVNPDIRNRIGASLEAKAKALHVEIDKYQWTGKGSQERMQALVRSAWQFKHLKALKDRASVTGVMIEDNAWSLGLGTQDVREMLKAAVESGQPPAGLYVAQGVDWVAWCKEAVKGLPEAPMTKKGYSTAGETLEGLMDIVPQFQTYMDLKHVEKMLENYVFPYKYPTAHPRFVPLVSTGRTGCRGGGSSSNMQNIPRKDKDRPEEAFRTMFKARKGRVLGTTDYSQLELCTLAATIRVFYPEYPCALGDAIDSGKDVHCITGALFSGLAYEQMIAGKKAKDEKIIQIRQASKAVNFGKPGGLGVPAMVAYAKSNYGVTMSIDEMRKLDNAWKRAWPEVPNKYLKTNLDLIAASPTDSFTAHTITGRDKADCIYTEGSNFSFQGLAADGAKAAMWGIWREEMLGWYWSKHTGQGYGWQFRDSPLRESRIVNFVHDEIVGEHPEGDLGKAALARQDAIMVSEMTRICQNKIKISVESQLSDAWEH
jgi:DNA polymerase-1